jgi:hypothetical protein
VSRQGFYSYLESRGKPYKYALLVALMKEIIGEDECNDSYGVKRMREALVLKQESDPSLKVPSQSTIARIMRENGLY